MQDESSRAVGPEARRRTLSLSDIGRSHLGLPVGSPDLSSQTRPLAALPAGVTPFVGWAHRFVVVAYGLWVMAAALPLPRPPAQ